VKINDLDISRQTFVVLVKRAGRPIVPHGDFKLIEGDSVFLLAKGKDGT